MLQSTPAENKALKTVNKTATAKSILLADAKKAKAKKKSKAAAVGTEIGRKITRAKVAEAARGSGATPYLRPDLRKYLKSLADPFGTPITRCPVNYNPVPSFVTLLATMRSTHTLNVTASTATQVSLYPGHTTTVSMDGPSYHSRYLNVGPGAAPAVLLGPIPSPTYPCSAGFVCQQLTLDTACVTPTDPQAYSLAWDNPLPFTTNPSNAGHFRWRLLSMGVLLINKTPVLNRGGIIRSVQPVSKQQFATQFAYDVNPTYREYDACEPIEISWIPRTDDLAFWHGDESTPAAVNNLGAAINIWLQAPSAGQIFEMQIIAHWEIAGSQVLQLGGPTDHMPSDKNIIEPTIDHMANSSSDARNALHIGVYNAAKVSGVGVRESKGILDRAMEAVTDGAVAAISHVAHGILKH